MSDLIKRLQEADGGSLEPWFKDQPREALQWLVDFGLPDLRDAAANMEAAAKDRADYIRGKADLMEAILLTALQSQEPTH